MTIKSKLILNLLLNSIIILLICLGGYSSLKFIQDRFVFMAEKSTPNQLRTVELERNLQHTSLKLMKVLASRNMQEFVLNKFEAEQALIAVTEAEKKVNEFRDRSKKLTVANEFNLYSKELFNDVSDRIISETAAKDIRKTISMQLDKSSLKLKELEKNIISLQSKRAALFEQALKNTELYSEKLKAAEELRNNVKDLRSAIAVISVTLNKTSLLIAKGRINSIVGRISKNKYSNMLSSDISRLVMDSHEFVELIQDFISSGKDEDLHYSEVSRKELEVLNNSIQLTLNQEIDLLSAKLKAETRQQGIIFSQSAKANEILRDNASLVALSLTIISDINQLFLATTTAELEEQSASIDKKFNQLHLLAESEEKQLLSILIKDEHIIMRNAHNELEKIHSAVFSGKGVIEILKRSIENREKSENIQIALHKLVEQQSQRGNENITKAESDQYQTIQTVNRMIQDNISRIAILGFILVATGMILGYWVSRSVLSPLEIVVSAIRKQTAQVREKATLAESIASGDFDRQIVIGKPLVIESINNDEFGIVMKELMGMSNSQIILDRAFSDMTTSLHNNRDEEKSRDRIKNGMVSLNLILREELPPEILADQALSFLMNFISAGVGIMYSFQESSSMLLPIAHYAVPNAELLNRKFKLGEGLVGEAALKRKMLSIKSIPSGYLPIGSTTISSIEPLTIFIMPVMHNNNLAGIMEFGVLNGLKDDDMKFLNLALEGVAIAFMAASSRRMVAELLEQTQLQSEELRVRHDDLFSTNN